MDPRLLRERDGRSGRESENKREKKRESSRSFEKRVEKRKRKKRHDERAARLFCFPGQEGGFQPASQPASRTILARASVLSRT